MRPITMRPITRFAATCSTSLAVACLVFTPAANAQHQSPAAPSPAPLGTTLAPADISDKKLDATAVAVRKVSAIKGAFDQKLAHAPAAEQDRLIGEANDAMTNAVTEEGLSVEEYTTILEVAESDLLVRAKLMERLK
ncbi:MAG: DUF4168 domain-containing protein [Rhodospirillales bacterium]|nr:DUF4168 domain-containing protein [Rhodospirillales bacterium]